MADAANDAFEGEILAERILDTLRRTSEQLRTGGRGSRALVDLVGPGFRGTRLTSSGAGRSLGALSLYSSIETEEPRLDADQFAHEAERLLSRFRRIETAEFHITSISLLAAGDRPAAATEIHFELVGYADPDEQRRIQVSGDWTLEWAGTGDGWHVRKWTARKIAIAEVSRPLFADVTESALGHNPSYRTQLRPGSDHWRSTVDSAIGIDVYGHHGVSLGDIDGDNDADLYVSQPPGLPNRLFRNDGDFTFTDITEAAGLGALDGTSMSLFADLDNDGDQDLILISARGPVMLRNSGAGAFAPDSGAFAFEAPPTSQLTSAALADYDRDGDLDLYLCSYRYHAGAGTQGAPAPYHDANNGPPNHLLQNRGDGTFADVTRASGMNVNNRRFSFAAAWGDYDADGWPDLYVANDFGRNNLYRNLGDGTFADVAPDASVEDIGAGMSAAWLDFDQDGTLDLYVGNMWSSAGLRLTGQPMFRKRSGGQFSEELRRHAKGNSLFRGLGNGQFEDVSSLSGTARGRWAWSSDALDLNNDGLEDLYVSNGYVSNTGMRDL